MCLGAVNGGVKFCTNSCDQFAIAAHQKKVEVQPNHVYISGGKKSAFTYPHLPAVASGTNLNIMLGKLRPREDWLCIFQSMLEESAPEPKFESSVVTPKKRKFWYLTVSDNMATDDPLLSSSFSLWALDTPDAIKTLVFSVQNLDTKLRDFQLTVSEDVDAIITRI